MKVAVSALGATLDDSIDERFGRATQLLFVDSETYEFEAVDNHENRNAMQGAGIGTAELVAGRGAQVVITGHLGPKAFSALKTAGIEGYNGTGMTARDAVAALVAGQLELLGEAPSHKGMQK